MHVHLDVCYKMLYLAAIIDSCRAWMVFIPNWLDAVKMALCPARPLYALKEIDLFDTYKQFHRFRSNVNISISGGQSQC